MTRVHAHERFQATRKRSLSLALKLVTQPPRVKISASASPELIVSFLSPASSASGKHNKHKERSRTKVSACAWLCHRKGRWQITATY